MKIAVASQNRKQITDHTGRCRRFWIYDIKNGEIEKKSLLELPKEKCFHELPHDASSPLEGVQV